MNFDVHLLQIEEFRKKIYQIMNLNENFDLNEFIIFNFNVTFNNEFQYAIKMRFSIVKMFMHRSDFKVAKKNYQNKSIN